MFNSGWNINFKRVCFAWPLPVCKTGGGHFFAYVFWSVPLKMPEISWKSLNRTDGTDVILLKLKKKKSIYKKYYKRTVQRSVLSVLSVLKKGLLIHCVFQIVRSLQREALLLKLLFSDRWYSDQHKGSEFRPLVLFPAWRWMPQQQPR